jgi:hypothetical protein
MTTAPRLRATPATVIGAAMGGRPACMIARLGGTTRLPRSATPTVTGLGPRVSVRPLFASPSPRSRITERRRLSVELHGYEQRGSRYCSPQLQQRGSAERPMAGACSSPAAAV